MRLLRDKDLVALIRAGLIQDFKKTPTDWYDKNSLVQPASVDLHIGKIYLPEAEENKRGCITKPKTDYHTLKTGETILVEVEEMLNVPSDHAGFGFPPSSLAVKGILMTNPGHIDPGFQGRLTFTLINVSRDPFTIRCGDIIFTTIWVQMESKSEKDYRARGNAVVDGVKEQNIDVLRKDFMDVDKRATVIAESISKGSVNKATIIAAAITLVGVLIAGGLQYAVSNKTELKKQIADLSQNVAVLESRVNEGNTKKIIELESSIAELKSHMAKLNKNR